MINLISDEQIEAEFELELDRLKYWAKYNYESEFSKYRYFSIAPVLDYLNKLDISLKSKLISSNVRLVLICSSPQDRTVGVQVYAQPNKSRRYSINILCIGDKLQFENIFMPENLKIITQEEFERLICEQF